MNKRAITASVATVIITAPTATAAHAAAANHDYTNIDTSAHPANPVCSHCG